MQNLKIFHVDYYKTPQLFFIFITHIVWAVTVLVRHYLKYTLNYITPLIKYI